jgi:hypothetical protein
VLAVDLQGRGAATADQLYHRLSWFMLPFDLSEVLQILDSARRGGIVERLGHDLDAFGKPISEEWFLTEEGKKLKRPRALSLPDLGRGVIGSTAGTSTVFSSIKGTVLGAAPYLAVVLGAKLDVTTEVSLASVIAGGAVLGVTLWNGVHGDLKLQAAARSWPRMREKRPRRYVYQLSRARLAFIPAVLAILYVILAAGVVLSFGVWEIAAAAAATAISAIVFYLSALRKLRKAWSGDHKDLNAWEWTWRLRGPASQIPSVPVEDGQKDGAVNARESTG